MKKVLLVAALVSLVGCSRDISNTQFEYHCSEKAAHNVAEFVLECSRFGEEDKLEECDQLAKEYFCPVKQVKYVCNNTTAQYCNEYNADTIEVVR